MREQYKGIFASDLLVGDRFTLSPSEDQTVFTVSAIGWGIDGKNRVANPNPYAEYMELLCCVTNGDDLSLIVADTRQVYLLAPMPQLVMPNQLMSGDKFSIYPSDEPIEIDHVITGSQMHKGISPGESTFVFSANDPDRFYCLGNDRRVYRHIPMREVKPNA